MKHPNGTIYTYVPGGVRILYPCGTKRFIKNEWYDCVNLAIEAKALGTLFETTAGLIQKIKHGTT